MHIRNPIEWSGAQLSHAGKSFGAAYSRALHHMQETAHSQAPSVKTIGREDLVFALRAGARDFGAYRTDVIFLCLVYVVVGLVLARLAFGLDMLPMLFPLAFGFALIGPFAAVGLYEMSRRREQGMGVHWTNALDVLREPSFPAIAMLGLMQIVLFFAWLGAAWGIYLATLGPVLPESFSAFVTATFTTPAGWMMIAIGGLVGLLFAALTIAMSIVSFPLLLDRDVGLDTAIATSFRVVRKNPGTITLWAVIVGAGLLIGMIPLFTGLIITLPVLGHATWHLYRRAVAR